MESISKQQVNKLIKAALRRDEELKFFSVSQPQTAQSYAASLTQLAPVPQGTTDSTRVGDQLVIRHMRLKGSCVLAAADVTNLMRILIFYWHPHTTPVASDIMLDNGAATSVFSEYSTDHRKEFTVMYDKLFNLDAAHVQQIWEFNKKLNIKVQFVAASTTTAHNMPYIMCLSDSSAAAHPTFGFSYKLTYIDP